MFFFFFLCPRSSYCLDSSLDRRKARGKVLVCRHAESSSESKLAKSVVVKDAGGVGMILVDEADKNVAIPFVIPAAMVGNRIGHNILSYLSHTRFVLHQITTFFQLLIKTSNVLNHFSAFLSNVP